MKLEAMDEFFVNRVEGYDEHMLGEVKGCREGYIQVARAIPPDAKTLLDLGCGTGLELDEIFKLIPDIDVTGIDMTEAMLRKLREKHPDKRLNLVCGSYFDVDFGSKRFDAAVSFESLHHYSLEDKLKLYERVCKSLKPKGVYAECDYMVGTVEEEEYFFAENARLRREQGIGEREYYHFDTPCAIETQISLLKKAGFSSVDMLWRESNTTLIVAKV